MLDGLWVGSEGSPHEGSLFGVFGDGFIDEVGVLLEEFVHALMIFFVDVVIEVLFFGVESLSCISHFLNKISNIIQTHE